MIDYTPLWKLLIDKGLIKKDLYSVVSRSTVTNMRNGKPVSLASIDKICKYLESDISQVVNIKR